NGFTTARSSLNGDIADDLGDLCLAEPCAGREDPALILAALAEERANALDAETVELVDGAKHGKAARRVLRSRETYRLHHAIQHLAVVDLDHVVAARDAKALHGVGSEHADLGIG